MKQAGVPFHVVELDQKHDEPTGSDIQSALATKTGMMCMHLAINSCMVTHC
jgi:hypothetical protein